MTTIEVIFQPDVHSDSCYTILGCGRSGSPEELRKAYRDLSRKYHPDRYRANKDTNHAFQRVYVAYSLICKSPQEGEDVKFERQAMRQAMRQVHLEDARRAYESAFGDFKEKYYSKGAIVALPYPFELRERLERGKCFREAFTLQIGCLQFNLFRSFLIKKELGVLFLLSEIICVWGSLSLAVWNFLLEEFPEVIDEIPYVRDSGIEEIPHISIIGGLAVLIGSFVQHFWYGFTRHPILVDDGYGNWLWDGESSSSGELGEILRICSQYYHSDVHKRSQVLTCLLCLPFLLVDQIPAILLSIPVYLFFLCQNCGTRNESTQTHLAYQFAKSIGGLLVVVGTYLAWVLGGNYAKLACAGVLYVNQHLYSAILFRKSVFGFLQSVIFQGFFAVSIVRTPRKQTIAEGKGNAGATDIEQGVSREKKESAPNAVNNKPEAPAKAATRAPAPAVKRNQVSPQKVIEEEVIDIVPVASESPRKKPASAGMEQADPDDFGATFDGFYFRPSPSTTKSQGSRPSTSTKSQGSLAPTTTASGNTESIGVDHRGKKYIKPVPGWYQKGEVITDTQQAAKEAQLAPKSKGFDNINIFQCGADTTLMDEEEKYFDPALSLSGDKETATGFTSTKGSTKGSTKASTVVTSFTSKMDEKQSPEAEAPDLVNLARSAKRRIEAEFYARIYGTPAGTGISSPVSPERKGVTRLAPQPYGDDEQDEFIVPRTIEMKTPPKEKMASKSASPISPSTASLADNTSDNGSGKNGENTRISSDESTSRMDDSGFIPMYKSPDRQGGNAYPAKQKRSMGNRADNRPKSPEGEIDNLLGPFVPFVKSATTRSNNYSVGASQTTRMQSNKERETQGEESSGFVLQHHPGKGLSGYRHEEEEKIRSEKSDPGGRKFEEVKPIRSRTTGQIPDLVVGYEQPSADESEITMDKRQFRKKQDTGPPTFWDYWTSPTNSTLTRSVQ
ncbi:unnamed protein product [Cylindrotheca closterium]|uniref:J domain-containing protein n=1 Tax=Cylindrotheca closterium TaxID=2856 RepID=A0AAD2CL79_9STRA|nr:unnamed protein product [Cylindrotheca closterium]